MLIQYKGKVQTTWKLAKVEEVFPDQHGVVRTCTVVFRPKHKGDKILPYKVKPLQELRIAVQRLCVLLPIEEQTRSDAKKGEEALVGAGQDKEKVPDQEDNSCLPPLANPEEDDLDEVQSNQLEDRASDDEVQKSTKLSRKEKMRRSKDVKEPKRFSRLLAGFCSCCQRSTRSLLLLIF